MSNSEQDRPEQKEEGARQLKKRGALTASGAEREARQTGEATERGGAQALAGRLVDRGADVRGRNAGRARTAH